MSDVPAPACSALVTPAWVMAGWGRNVAGVLVAGDCRLAFLTEEGPLFDAPITEVTEVSWPWHWVGGGVKLRAAGTPYKITFILPNGAQQAPPSLIESGIALVTVAAGAVPSHSLAGFVDIRGGRAAGRRWKEVLPAA
jgi:hypothetical protein